MKKRAIRTGYAPFESVIALCFLAVVLGVFKLGHLTARTYGASRFASFAWGIASEVAFWSIALATAYLAALASTRQDDEESFLENFSGYLASGVIAAAMILFAIEVANFVWWIVVKTVA